MTSETVPKIENFIIEEDQNSNSSDDSSFRVSLKVCKIILVIVGIVSLIGIVAAIILQNEITDSLSNEEIIVTSSEPPPLELEEEKEEEVEEWDTEETTEGTPCPEDFIYFEYTGYCYKIVDELRDFEVAEHLCTTRNAHLASIHSIEEHTFLVGLAHSAMQPEDEPKPVQVFIGLNKTNGKWRWTDESPLDFRMWAPGNGPIEVEDGTNAVISRLKFQWDVDKQKMNGRFICKKAPRGTKPINPSSSTDTLKCSPHFEPFSETGHCYRAYPNTYKTYDEAKKICQSQNSLVSSVASFVENVYLIGFYLKTRDSKMKRSRIDFFDYSEGPIIGLEIKNRRHIWTDQTKWGYVNWKNGKRFKKGNQHTKLMLLGGKWLNTGGGTAGFICKQSATPKRVYSAEVRKFMESLKNRASKETTTKKSTRLTYFLCFLFSFVALRTNYLF